TGDVTVSSALRAEAARIYWEKLQEPKTAIELYRKLLEEPNAGALLRLEAARHLETLYADTAQTEERLGVLLRIAEFAPEKSEKRATLLAGARLAESLKLGDKSLEIWNACLETDPTNRDALDGVVELLLRQEKWEGAIAALRKGLSHVTPWQRRVDL